MSEQYKFIDPDGMYFVTPTIVGWADLFTKQRYWHLVLDSLEYCQQNKGLIIHAWCVMSSHLHLIIRTEGIPLPDIMRDFKKFTSKKIMELLDEVHDSREAWLRELFRGAADRINRVKNYKVWQDGSHPVLLNTNKMIDQRLNYTHNNPVVAGFVQEPVDYLLSSARDYAGESGLLKIERIE